MMINQTTVHISLPIHYVKEQMLVRHTLQRVAGVWVKLTIGAFR